MSLVYIVGFFAQALFSARLIIQWFLSEKAHKVVSPAIFWKLSILASFLLLTYGWLRDDFAVILGQIISYYIYIFNLKIQGNWTKFNIVTRTVFILMPIAAIGYAIPDWSENCAKLFKNEDIPLPLLIYGTLGQIIFTLRFIYQWYYSKRKGESLLPMGFWVISLIGSLTIISYAIFRLDPVLILGQSTGAIVYTRNIFIIRNERKINLKKNSNEEH